MIWLGEKYQQKRTHVFVLEKAMQEEWCSMQPLTAAAMSSWLAVFALVWRRLAARSVSRSRSIFEVDPFRTKARSIYLCDDERRHHNRHNRQIAAIAKGSVIDENT